MKQIPLTKGQFALVDDADFDFLMQWKWHVYRGHDGLLYAHRNSEYGANGKRTHIMMHRVINATPEGMDTDHINGNGLDNRRSNLRTASRAENMWNRRPNKGGSSPFKGVYWHAQHRKWVASIQVNKKRKHIGLFTTQEEAATAYQMRAVVEQSAFQKGEGR